MEKEAFDLEVLEDTLIVNGEKRFEREQTDGRYRVLQCAYGSFRRIVPLPARVLPGQANATYANGVLKINLPKAAPGKPEKHTIKVT
jgi:HSP20 family protein